MVPKNLKICSKFEIFIYLAKYLFPVLSWVSSVEQKNIIPKCDNKLRYKTFFETRFLLLRIEKQVLENSFLLFSFPAHTTINPYFIYSLPSLVFVSIPEL